MQPFVKGHFETDAVKLEIIIADAMKAFPRFTREEVLQSLKDEHETGEVWINEKYQVIKRQMPEKGEPELYWLSIKRRDREPIHDWRDLQEIKNMLVGEENEGIELYPAESRKVDTSNQYHLWVLADPKQKLPFGFPERAVYGESLTYTKQRPL